MAYEEKTDWLPDDPINEDDVNRWEKGIKDAHTDLAAHKNDMNNPHNTTKAQVGLGNVDNVQQAAKKDFDKHISDETIHISSSERTKWNNAQLTKLTDEKGKYLASIQNGLDFHKIVEELDQTFFFYTDKTGINTPPFATRGLYIGYKSYGEALAMDYEGGTWRKTLNDSGWTDWVQLETSEGAQFKVRSHEEKTEIHVNKSDKDKWNSGQLFKVTADNGTQKINLSSGSFYDSLKDVGTVTFYGTNAVTDNPSDTSLRGMQLVGQLGIGIGYAVDVRGNAWWFFYNANDSAINWYQIESTTGAQSKIDGHANKADIHVTKSDKDKWNNAQLYKLTDTQGCRTKIPDGTDLLTLPSGFYYALGNVIINNPVSGDGSWYNYDVIETGGGGRKTIFASRSYDGIFWMATIHTDGVFKGWNKIETEVSAQTKADKALADAKNYVDTNYTNQKLTILTGSNAIQDARTGGNEYPPGLTLMDIGQGNTTGYPLGYGIVKNEKYSNYRFTQYFYGTGNETSVYANSTGTWIRHWWSGSGWTPWEKISGFGHMIAKTTGKQALNKGEQNKILFKNVLKDSNNLYDPSNSRFVASHAGMYLVNASLYFQNTLQYSNFELYTYVNGSQYKLMNQFRTPAPKDNSDSKEFYVTVTGSVAVSLNAGDYVEIYVYVGYTGTETRYIVDDTSISKNYFDILELGGRNFPTL
ncbi:terminase [Bacillus mojavensis]|uniref:terminase n=1 Tax=Bacillus mojavensis TaxID=72360 RepID=UPI0002886CC5|nr:terminase [Bacillus mojavensis]MDR4227322.1 terminase [Bacillus mojavensis]MEC1737404.1 terminase [Bacillus mojavensis]MEC1794765.1 terminase [Bacillus mojavensis]MEC3587981.1 terminase [Bacillus mojavensis]MEC5244050.1 terminase [Bacillus mojavensis]